MVYWSIGWLTDGWLVVGCVGLLVYWLIGWWLFMNCFILWFRSASQLPSILTQQARCCCRLDEHWGSSASSSFECFSSTTHPVPNKLFFVLFYDSFSPKSKIPLELHPRWGDKLPEWNRIIPYHTILYYTILYHTVPYYTIPYHAIPYHTIP